MLGSFLIIGLVLLFTFIYMKKNGNYWKKRGIVYVNGVLFNFFLGKRPMSEIYKEIFDKHPQQNHIGIFLGSPILLVKDRRDIQAILQSNFLNFNSRGVTNNPNDILSDNILFMEDYNRWKLLRNKFSPIYTTMKLKNMYYIMNKCAQDFIQFIEENKCDHCDTYNTLYNYTTSCIGASLFGIDAKSKTTMNSPFLDMARSAVEPSLAINISAAFTNLSPLILSLINFKVFGNHEDFFIGTVKKVMQLRRLDKNKEKRHDFIEMCLELQDQGSMKDAASGYEIEATDEVLAAQAFFFFLAGIDTSAVTMHFTLLELAGNPNILERLHNEIDKTFEECNGNLKYQDIDKLEYLDMIINEAMRKYPPIGLIMRRCTEAVTLPSGIKMEKDSLINIPVYTLHRDEKLFPNPTVFDPERFSPENISKIKKFSYLPFSDGNRMCLGARFARIQVKSGLSWLLRKYTLKYQKYETVTFTKCFFGLKDEKANFELVRRQV